jgi:1-acyl-sn-glycerol-3-phosphate acyltransferase
MRSLLTHPLQKVGAGRSGVILALAWGVAEALWWPVVPDFLVFALVPLTPRRWWKFAAAASFGSAMGGALGYALAGILEPDVLLAAAPLVTDRMAEVARGWLIEGGSAAILRQPLSGIPYKVFVFVARDVNLNFAGFLIFSVIARAFRIFAVGGVAGLIGWVAGRERVARYYDIFLALVTISFGVGLWRVIASFS